MLIEKAGLATKRVLEIKDKIKTIVYELLADIDEAWDVLIEVLNDE